MKLETKLKGVDLFDQLSREESGDNKIFKANKSKKIDFFIREFRLFCRCADDLIESNEIVREYERIFSESDRYPAKVIEQLPFLLYPYEKEDDFADGLGLYLSFLIKFSPDNRFVIHTKQFEVPFNFIGFRNEKKTIIIKGDAGDYVGSEMSGGEIEVSGNIGGYSGNCMEGGKIVIHGNAGAEIGIEMRRGEIHLHGKYKSIGPLSSRLSSDFPYRKIFHKGKLIVQDDRWVK